MAEDVKTLCFDIGDYKFQINIETLKDEYQKSN